MPARNDGYIVSSRLRISLFYAYLIAIFMLAAVVIHVILDNRQTAQQSHRALCTLKIEREHRVKQTADILNSHDPADMQIVKSFGRPLLIRSLNSEKADRDALKDVSC